MKIKILMGVKYLHYNVKYILHYVIYINTIA